MNLSQNIRCALRSLAGAPTFSAVAVLSLALGIGANTALFTMMDAILWKTLPVKDPEQLVSLGPGPYVLYRQARDGNQVVEVVSLDWKSFWSTSPACAPPTSASVG